MSNPDIIKSSFQKWKIWTAIFLGIFVAAFMLYRSLNETRFVKVDSKNGTHEWIDGNQNGLVDLSLASDFQVKQGGDFKIESLSDVTTILSGFASSAANIVHSISGLPLHNKIFLLGKPLEPPRAGIIAKDPFRFISKT